ncbi:hypothetical protein [Streptomyces sp. NPDC004284]|uniref:hypothetical protein n=1 Tax=Streptomyces sp. NPDC004284 TaxID=3364695 RepID=UPI0036CF58EB
MKYALGLLACEWIKLRSVRSTWIVTACGVAGALALTLLSCNSTLHHWNGWTPEERAAFDPLGASFSGFVVLQVAMVVLGAVDMGNEYATGSIGQTFAAVPRRFPALLAKAGVTGAFGLLVGLVTSLAGFLCAQAMFATRRFGISVQDPGAVRAVAGSALFAGALAVLGLALASLMRSGLGSVTAGLGVLLVAPLIVHADEGWLAYLRKALPTSAARRLLTDDPGKAVPSTAHSWWMLLLYPAVATLTMTFVVRRRDV